MNENATNDVKISVREWIDKFNAGEFTTGKVEDAVKSGFYDWFCKDDSLTNKVKWNGPKIKTIAKSEKIDVDKMYVFIKNNRPVKGKLYDDFRFCDIETGETLYTVVPKSGYTGKSEVWAKENEFKEALVCSSWKDVKNFFGL